MPVSGYVENMQQTCGHPLAGPGCLVEPTRQETHSKRLFVARLEGQSAWARIYPIEMYMKLGIGFKKRKDGGNDRISKWSAASLDQSLGITLHSTRVDCEFCGDGFYSIEY